VSDATRQVDGAGDDTGDASSDGGLPGRVGRINGFGDGLHWYRCQECGATGATLDAIGHHERCPGGLATGPDHDVPVGQQPPARQRELVGRDGGGE